jgi:hypothetical protein
MMNESLGHGVDLLLRVRLAGAFARLGRPLFSPLKLAQNFGVCQYETAPGTRSKRPAPAAYDTEIT